MRDFFAFRMAPARVLKKDRDIAACYSWGSKRQDTRCYNIYEDDQLDEAQFAAWVKQASQLPGERL
jgi:hypothetical protein